MRYSSAYDSLKPYHLVQRDNAMNSLDLSAINPERLWRIELLQDNVRRSPTHKPLYQNRYNALAVVLVRRAKLNNNVVAACWRAFRVNQGHGRLLEARLHRRAADEDAV